MTNRTIQIGPQCSELVSPKEPWGSFHRHRCHRPVKVQRDGLWYCSIHDPEYVKAKEAQLKEASDARYIRNLPRVYGHELLAMLEKILPDFAAHTRVVEQWATENAGHKNDAERLNRTLLEAKALIADAKGEKKG